MISFSNPRAKDKKGTPNLKLKFHQVITLVLALCLGLSAGTLSYTQILYSPDEYITNYIYTYNPFETADNRIILVAIDDTSEDIYGNYSDWSRELLAQAVTTLSSSGAAVIALDTDLSEQTVDSEDTSLVDACQDAGNVVAVATADFDTPKNGPMRNTPPDNTEIENPIDIDKELDFAKDTLDIINKKTLHLSNPADSSMRWRDHQMNNIQYPFDALKSVVTVGISNAMQQSVDGTIRSAALSVNFKQNNQDSFASAIYKKYQDYSGEAYSFPELNNDNLFGFNPVLKPDTYKIISFSDILSGNYDKKQIEGNIILVGEFNLPEETKNFIKYARSDEAKQDILVQASILQALLTQRTIEDVDPLLQASLYAVIITFFYLLLSRRKTIFTIIVYTAFLGVVASFAYLLNLNGHRLLLLVPLIFVIISIILFLLQNLLFTTIARHRMEHTLKMYVDSQVVDEITEVAPFALSGMSERRNIAVLFVDIRGFTTLSETLEPEQVVEILNQYFSVVYTAIASWNGTLDKFIGDAAMAIFNAPRDLDDYVFHAACAADDIIKGFEEIRQFFQERYDTDVNVGIGINCGDAIVGNIGCAGRMDYTAIGDTVNTASRLESKAAPGQILISESVQHQLEGRSQTQLIGDLELKGKAKAVTTYQIDEIDKPDPPNMLARKEYQIEKRLLHTKTRPN